MGTPGSRAGFSLIELMISMMLGVSLVGGAASLFLAQARSAELGQTLAELQNQARFALDELAAAVRSAGYAGCSGLGGRIPAMPASIDASAVPRTDWRPIDGFTITATGWLPAEPDGYGSAAYVPPASGPATPVAGSDALLVEGGTGQGSAINAGASGASSLTLGHFVPGLVSSAMGLVGDCAGAEAFFVDQQVANANGSATLTTREPRAFIRPLDPAYPLGGRVIPYRRALYFVGDTGRVTEHGEPIRALYEHMHPFAETTPHELANGVEALVLRYRQRGTGGAAVQELAADDAAFDPSRVIAVRMGLLISHAGHRVAAEQTRGFVLSGIPVAASGTEPSHPDDTRLRRAVERSASLRARNETPEP